MYMLWLFTCFKISYSYLLQSNNTFLSGQNTSVSLISIWQHKPLNSQVCQRWSLSHPSLLKQFFQCCILIHTDTTISASYRNHTTTSHPFSHSAQAYYSFSCHPQSAKMQLAHLHIALHFPTFKFMILTPILWVPSSLKFFCFFCTYGLSANC